MLVSHDIDEALKLGDRIAVFRQGKIVQNASADELLARPANEFVASFVGQDRTLKRLLLVQAGDVADQQQTVTVRRETPLVEAFGLMDDIDARSVTVVDADGKPLGTSSAARRAARRASAPTVCTVSASPPVRRRTCAWCCRSCTSTTPPGCRSSMKTAATAAKSRRITSPTTSAPAARAGC